MASEFIRRNLGIVRTRASKVIISRMEGIYQELSSVRSIDRLGS